MKRTSYVTIVPMLAALGACSSSSNSPNRAPVSGNDGAVASDAGTGDDGAADEAATGDDGGSSATQYAAALQGAQVAPAVVTASTGTAKLALQADGITLNYDITQNVPNATSVNVHIGPAAENGNTTHQLTPVSGHMTGSIMLSMDEQNALAVDQLYIDVESSAHPGGEVRGQITLPGATLFVAHASGSQEVPSVTSAYAAHASFIMSPDQSTMIYHVSTTAVPTDVRVQRGIASINGQTVYSLTNIGQTFDGTLQLSASDPADVQAGRFYLNIVTAANLAGELRGQVLAPGETLFSGVLSGANEVPSVPSQATGSAQFILSADQTLIKYEADVNGIIPTAAEVDNAPPGMNGPMMYQLTLAQQGVQGQAMMAAGNLTKLVNGNVYINVRTASYVNGELRAQLVAPLNNMAGR
jgi:hypothetical protein